MKTSLLLMVAAAALAAPPTYKVVNKIKVGGGVRWDYAFVDSGNHRLYVSHGTQTEVIDTSTDKLVGTIPDTKGVHGIAVANDLGRGFTSDGGDNDVTVFDLKTLKVLSKVKTGQNPDAIIYEPASRRVFTFNGRSKDSTAIDAKTGEYRGQERDRRDRREECAGGETQLHRAVRRPERPRHRSEEGTPLFGLRQQDDDRVRSGRGQSPGDAGDWRGNGRRGIRRRVCVQREWRRWHDHDGRRNVARQVHSRGHHSDDAWRPDYRVGPESAQTISARG